MKVLPYKIYLSACLWLHSPYVRAALNVLSTTGPLYGIYFEVLMSLSTHPCRYVRLKRTTQIWLLLLTFRFLPTLYPKHLRVFRIAPVFPQAGYLDTK